MVNKETLVNLWSGIPCNVIIACFYALALSDKEFYQQYLLLLFTFEFVQIGSVFLIFCCKTVKNWVAIVIFIFYSLKETCAIFFNESSKKLFRFFATVKKVPSLHFHINFECDKIYRITNIIFGHLVIWD